MESLDALRFALIGNHPDGVAMAHALVQRGGRLVAYAGPAPSADPLASLISHAADIRDVEEVLARRDIDAVIVADDLEHREYVLRRAVQSEKHVLCVHPADLRPDIAYESAMIREDTKKVLLPILKERFVPGIAKLKALCQQGVIGNIQQIRCEWGTMPTSSWDESPLWVVWDVLRWLGGEINEVSAISTKEEELQPGDAPTLSGRLAVGGLFQVVITHASSPSIRLSVIGDRGQVELTGDQGLYGPTRLTTPTQMEEIPYDSPWLGLADEFGRAIKGQAASLTWLDATRCLELFDAVQRSVKRGRVIPLYYQDYTEEATFKGLMTSLGCGLLWLVLVMMIVGVWLPFLWIMIPILLVIFLGLQAFRWAVR